MTIFKIRNKLDPILKKYNQASSDFAKDKISISEHKIFARKFIEEIKELYDMRLKLKLSKRLEKANDLYGKSIDHLLKSTIFLQSYVDTDYIGKMGRYLEQATNEINLSSEYVLKFFKQVEKLTE
ncbi:hypothetical protein ES703_75686 [subsurface metagenome]